MTPIWLRLDKNLLVPIIGTIINSIGPGFYRVEVMGRRSGYQLEGEQAQAMAAYINSEYTFTVTPNGVVDIYGDWLRLAGTRALRNSGPGDTWPTASPQELSAPVVETQWPVEDPEPKARLIEFDLGIPKPDYDKIERNVR